MELSPQEVRVLGCLVEKELTTPQQYPLTLNALVSACNQSSNREPVVSYDEATVEQAVTTAKSRGLTRFVHPSHGRSAVRYRHELAEQLGLDRRQLALLAVLMLRGGQTPGELRARTDRMAGFDTLSDVEAELAGLADRQQPLVRRLPRAPGRKEDRYVTTVGLEPALRASPTDGRGPGEPAPESPAALAPVSPSPSSEDVWAEELAGLRAEVEGLRRDLDALRRQLGE